VALPAAYAIVRLDHVQPGTTDKPALDGLGAQLAQVWGATEQEAVLADLRSQLKVRVTDEGRKLINGSSGS
jgi:hypothetical protein